MNVVRPLLKDQRPRTTGHIQVFGTLKLDSGGTVPTSPRRHLMARRLRRGFRGPPPPHDTPIDFDPRRMRMEADPPTYSLTDHDQDDPMTPVRLASADPEGLGE